MQCNQQLQACLEEQIAAIHIAIAFTENRLQAMESADSFEDSESIRYNLCPSLILVLVPIF